MAKDDGLGLDILTRIVNVHWDSGLAVEFGKQAEDAPKPAEAPTSQHLRRNKKLMRERVG